MSEIIFKKSTINPITPGTGAISLFAKLDGNLYIVNDDGIINQVGGGSVFTSLVDCPSDYIGNAGKVVTVNNTETGLIFTTSSGGNGTGNVSKYEFMVIFTGTNPTSITGLPIDWSYTITSADITITHSVGVAPISIHYFGLNTVGSEQLWRYRLPTAANELTISNSNITTQFTFRLNTSVASADASGQAKVIVNF